MVGVGSALIGDPLAFYLNQMCNLDRDAVNQLKILLFIQFIELT